MSGYAAIIGDVPTIWVSDKTDSHTEIAEQFKLRDNGERELYAFEFYPGEFYPSADLTTWKLKWDSEATAGMREKPSDEFAHRIRPLIEQRAKKCVFSDGNHKVSGICRAWVFDSAEVEAMSVSRVYSYNSSTVTAYGSSTVRAYNSSTVTAYNSSTVTAYGNSTVDAYNSSTVTASCNSRVSAFNSSTVTAYGSSTVTAYGSSTVTAYGSSTVTAYGSSTVAAYGSSTVTAYGSSTVAAYGSSTVNSYGPEPKGIEGDAVWIDRTGNKSAVMMAMFADDQLAAWEAMGRKTCGTCGVPLRPCPKGPGADEPGYVGFYPCKHDDEDPNG